VSSGVEDYQVNCYGHLFPSGDDGAELAVAEQAFMTVS
jgi:hypothetical protein